MYKCEFENGPAWFNEKKGLIDSLKPQSNKKVQIVCPECGKERETPFGSITTIGHTFCKGCARARKNKNELIGRRFGRLVVNSFGQPYISPSRGEKHTVCVCKCDCGKQTEVLANSLKSGLTTSCGCAQSEYLSSLKGKASPSYNFDITDEQRKTRKLARKSSQHAAWSKEVKERDGCCVMCGSTEKLEAHHIESFADNIDLRFDVKNGITLCYVCHIEDYHRFQKKNKLPNTPGTFNAFVVKKAAEIREKGRSFISVLEDVFG